MRNLHAMRTWLVVVLLAAGCLLVTRAGAHDVEKQVFLVVDNDEIIASNTRLGRFDRLKLGPREELLDYKVASAVAVVVTNRRFFAYGALHGSWHSRRAHADEQVELLEVADYSATLVTCDRILNYSGRTGVWSETRR
jgi:hypothetical protein